MGNAAAYPPVPAPGERQVELSGLQDGITGNQTRVTLPNELLDYHLRHQGHRKVQITNSKC